MSFAPLARYHSRSSWASNGKRSHVPTMGRMRMCFWSIGACDKTRMDYPSWSRTDVVWGFDQESMSPPRTIMISCSLAKAAFRSVREIPSTCPDTVAHRHSKERERIRYGYSISRLSIPSYPSALTQRIRPITDSWNQPISLLWYNINRRSPAHEPHGRRSSKPGESIP